MVMKKLQQAKLWTHGEEGKSFHWFPKVTKAQAVKELSFFFPIPGTRMEVAKCQNIFKWFIDVPWPPLIPLPSGCSVDGSPMVGGSPFGRSLVPNRDSAYLHEVLWPGRDGDFGTRW